jgi:sulfatase modifying factor 1
MNGWELYCETRQTKKTRRMNGTMNLKPPQTLWMPSLWMALIWKTTVWTRTAGLSTIGLLVFAPMVCLAQPAPAPKKMAFIVGVSKYHKDGLEDLQFAHKDADDLATELKKHDFDVMVLTGEAATHAAVERGFRSFVRQASKLGKTDVALVAFSGHGVQKMVPVTGADNQSRLVETPFVCVVDTLVSDPETMINLNWVLGELIEKSGASSNLVLVDACRNNPDKGAKTLDGSTVKELPTKLSILFSSSPGQRSYESPQLQQGVFTHVLLQGLRGEAKNSRNEVDWLKLAAHIVSEVPVVAADVLGDANLVQRPNLVSNSVTSPILARLNNKPPAPAPLSFPFDSATAKSSQTAWAAHLGIEVSTKNSVGLPMVLIPPGEFMMGSKLSAEEVHQRFPGGEVSYYEREHPRHRVTLREPFYMSATEVTVAQFRRFVEAETYETDAEQYDSEGGYGFDEASGGFKQDKQYHWRNPGFKQGDDEPVVNVSWNDAKAYCEWLSRVEGREYRLPTEAEWEYACRAGSDGEFSFGSSADDLHRHGNVADASAKERFSGWTTVPGRDGYVFTSPVGRFRANAFGLFDMHGNVWEWCSDWYGNYASGSQVNPTGPESGVNRVDRGGSWRNAAWSCRAAYRYGFSPSGRDFSLGFRPVSVSQP